MAAEFDESRAALTGSAPRHAASARTIAGAETQEPVAITIALRRAAQSPGGAEGANPQGARSGGALGASASDIEAVSRFATGAGLTVVATDAARRTVTVTGSPRAAENAFKVHLKTFSDGRDTYRSYAGDLSIPAELRGVIVAVLGLHERPVAQPRLCPVFKGIHPRTDGGPYSPSDLAAAYGFPDGTGARQCVGVIELGGGYLESDLTLFCQKSGLTPARPVDVLIDGATNNYGVDAIADSEVALDLDVIAELAPLARIAVYFAPNTESGFLKAIGSAIHDATNAPSILSISWGGAEGWWTPQAMTAYDQTLEDAATLGVTVFCASGDSGSNDSGPDSKNYVDFPASSPHVTACGGTQLVANGGQVVSEVAWNDATGATGGGVSAFFTVVPDWQKETASTVTGGLAGRGVPDVSGDASGLTGYQCVLGGQWVTMGGTSAVAPLWAGLLARIAGNASGRRIGLLNPILYRNASAFRDIVSGNNGAFAAGAGWDACTGLGSPTGALIRQISSGGSPSAPTATIRWTVPTARTDGTALPATQVAGADIYDATTLIGSVTGPVATFVTGPLSAGSHTFTVITHDTDGGTSTPSNAATAMNRLAPPAAIIDLTVVINY